jgi:copper chaperone
MKKLHIPDMTCGGCAKAVTRIVERTSKGTKLSIDLESRVVTLEGIEDLERIESALANGGYPTERLDGVTPK